MPAETKKKKGKRGEREREKGKKSVGMYVTCIIAEQRHARHFFPPPPTRPFARSWRYIHTHTHTHTHIYIYIFEALKTIELAGEFCWLDGSHGKGLRMVDGEYSRYTTYWQYRRIGYRYRGKCNFRQELWIGGSRFYSRARGTRALIRSNCVGSAVRSVSLQGVIQKYSYI